MDKIQSVLVFVVVMFACLKQYKIGITTLMVFDHDPTQMYLTRLYTGLIKSRSRYMKILLRWSTLEFRAASLFSRSSKYMEILLHWSTLDLHHYSFEYFSRLSTIISFSGKC